MINIFNCNAFYSSLCGRIEFCAPIKYVHDCYVQGQDAMPYILSILEHDKELANKLNSLDQNLVYEIINEYGYDVKITDNLTSYLMFEWASSIFDHFDKLVITNSENGKYYNINDNMFQDDPFYYNLDFFKDLDLMIPDNLYIDY